MRITVLFLLFFVFVTKSYTQDFEKVDSIIMHYPSVFKNPKKLAERIALDFNTDLEKVRALYTWMAINITYDMREFKKYSYSYISLSDKKKKETWHNRIVSKKTVSKGRAVCHGYALLFKAVCDELGIKAAYVGGYGKGSFEDVGRAFLLSRHAWNIVEIDEEKHLLDVTWASGKYRYYRNIFEYLFLTPPKDFIKNHYPDNLEYSLLEMPFSKNYFIKAPLFHLSKFSKVVKLISPLNGILNMSESKKRNFTFKGMDDIYMVHYKIGNERIEIKDFKSIDGVTQLGIDLTGKNYDKLTFFFNNLPIVTYRLIYP